MNIKTFLTKIKIDGQPVENVVQVTIDEEQVTVVYNHPREAGEAAQRVITLESEAVTIG